MSWMGGGGAPWDQDWSGGGEQTEEGKPKEFCKSLRPIKLSERYKAIEPEENEDEGFENESDGEPGNMLLPEDPNCRKDRVCPCGGLRNWYQKNCDCGTAIYWPVDDNMTLDGLHECAGYRSQSGRWKRAKKSKKSGAHDAHAHGDHCAHKMPMGQEEEEEEEDMED